MITAARNSAIGTPEARSTCPTSTRERMCGDIRAGGISGARPPR